MGRTEEISTRFGTFVLFKFFLQHQIEDFVGYGTSCEHVQGEKKLVVQNSKDQLRQKKWSASKIAV